MAGYFEKTWLVNALKTIINPATEEKQDDIIDGIGEVQETPTSYTILDRLKSLYTIVNTIWTKFDGLHVENESLSIIQHGHDDSSTLHFHIDLAAAATTRYIMIDLSDTVNWPHAYASVVHIDWFGVDVDSDNNGNYTLKLGFLANVDATDGDIHVFHDIAGSKSVGNQYYDMMQLAPDGWICAATRHLSSEITLNDTSYQTDVNLPTLIDPATADTPPGSGDIVLVATLAAGAISIDIDIGYHTHSPTHP